MSVNHRYKLLQGCFWMIFCAGTGFISLYLQGKGFTNTDIGTVTAVFGILAVILQPVLGRISDANSRQSWKTMLRLLALPFLATCVLMLVLPGKWAGLLIGILMLIANLMMPFVHSANFVYTEAGERINFGAARGIGSGLYALLALLIGRLADQYGISVVPVSGILLVIALLIIVAIMPNMPHVIQRKKENQSRSGGFIGRYPWFMVMLLAALLMSTSHNMVNTYLMQIIQSMGGNSSHLGVALAIQAVVEVPVLFCFSLLLRRFSPSMLMVISAAGYVLKALCYTVAGNIPMIYFNQLFQMCSFAIYASASVYYAAGAVLPEDRTTGQAFMTSMMAAGTVTGSFIGGLLLDYCGLSVLLWSNVAVAFVAFILAGFSARKAPSAAVEV